MVSIPKPIVPVGYNFFPIYIPMGIKYDPNPAPNRVFTRWVLGIGYPLASLTGTASTLAVATGKGRTSGTSSQPSSDDHADEAGLPTTGRQTYPINHITIASLFGAHLCPHRPHRPVLAS
jgi:hypothetical protein